MFCYEEVDRLIYLPVGLSRTALSSLPPSPSDTESAHGGLAGAMRGEGQCNKNPSVFDGGNGMKTMGFTVSKSRGENHLILYREAGVELAAGKNIKYFMFFRSRAVWLSDQVSVGQ